MTGVSFNISSNGKIYVFSLVKWGIVRKFLSKIFKANPYQFTPSYELAIYDKTEGRIHFSHPYFVFHFAKGDIAISRMNWMKTLFEEGISGIEKILGELPNFDSKREGMYSGPSDYLDWEITHNKKRT
jgi:hypothetical protein